MLTRQQYPPIVTGYELNPALGYFSVVLPLERTNLFTNPSFEYATTGAVVVSGSTLTRTTTEQRRGAYALQITPGAATDSGMYVALALSANTWYSFSLDVKTYGGRALKMVVTDTTGAAIIATKTFTAKGYWERPAMLVSIVSAGTYRFYLQKAGDAGAG